MFKQLQRTFRRCQGRWLVVAIILLGLGYWSMRQLILFQIGQTKYSRLKSAYNLLVAYRTAKEKFPDMGQGAADMAKPPPGGWRQEIMEFSRDPSQFRNANGADPLTGAGISAITPSHKESAFRKWRVVAVCDERRGWFVESKPVLARMNTAGASRGRWNPALIALLEFDRPIDASALSDAVVTSDGLFLVDRQAELTRPNATAAIIYRLQGGTEELDLQLKGEELFEKMVFQGF